MAAVAGVLVVALAVTLLLVGGGHKVRYEVETSTGEARIIAWDTSDGDLAKIPTESPDQRAATPWSTTETFKGSGTRVSVVVAAEVGSARCRLYVDGKLVSEYEGNLEALCEATLP